jgi:hypothetical protein
MVVNVVCQVIAARTGGNKISMLRSIILGFVVGAGVCVTLPCLAPGFPRTPGIDAAADLCAALITFACLGYCYFHFINLGETARRVRIVRELLEAGGSLTRTELLARYNADEMIRVRFSRMLKNKQVIERNGRYYIGVPLLLWMAEALALMKRIFLKKRSEYDA